MFRYILRELKKIFFASLFYRKLFLGLPYKYDLDMSNMNIPIKSYQDGHTILYGEITLNGKLYFFENFKSLHEMPEADALELASFQWLAHLMALDTRVASERSIALIDSWINEYSGYNNTYWQPGIIADRAFYIMLAYKFIANNRKMIIHNKILNYLSTQVRHLLNITYLKNDHDKLKVAKAIIMASTFYRNKSVLFNKAVKLAEEDIKASILNDGCHVSRNINVTAKYLEDLLLLDLIISQEAGHQNNLVRESIDKIAIFIRSIRHLDGELPTLQNSKEVDKEKIGYLLSLSKISSELTSYFRNSGYASIVGESSKIVIDVGKSVAPHNGLLSFEISDNKTKLIVSLGAPKNEIPNRSDYSGIIIYKEGKELYFPFTSSSVKVERRTEEEWEIIKLIYTGLKEKYNLSLYSTFYVNRKTGKYILGENLLINDGNISKLDSIHLRLHLYPKVKNIMLSSTNNYLVFNIDNKNYALSTPNSTLSVNKSTYYSQDGNEKDAYTIDMKFDINAKVIKNEWNIAIEDTP